MAGHPIRRVCFDRTPGFVICATDDRRAETFDRAHFRLGRGVHHHHRAARARLARRERHALRRVPGADRPDALLQRGGVELPNDVVRAADLERSDRLQHFELEIELRAAVRQLHPHQRRADCGAVHRSRGVADGGERNVTARNSGGQG